MPTEDIDDEQQGHQERNKREDVECWQNCVYVGVLQAGESSSKVAALDNQFEAIQPVRDGLQHQEDRDERGYLNLGCASRPVALGLQA